MIAEEVVPVRYTGTPVDMNLAAVLTNALPKATFVHLVRRCVESKRGEYFDNMMGGSVDIVRAEIAHGPEIRKLDDHSVGHGLTHRLITNSDKGQVYNSMSSGARQNCENP